MSSSKASTSKVSFSLARNDSDSYPAPSTNTEHDRLMLLTELVVIFDESINKCFPELNHEFSNLSRLKGATQKEYGDYACTDILTICEGLRRLDPRLLDQKRSRVIARELLEAVEKNPKNKMIEKLDLHDAGFLTFRLSLEWMTKRIKEMIAVGIDLWAPVQLEKLIVIDGPEPVIGADFHAEEIRSRYIKEMLICMLDYSGVSVSTCLLSNRSLNALREYFTEERGVITSNRLGTPLFAGKREDLAKKFHVDLQALWSAIYELEGQLIVNVTSVREREYVKKCFDVATNEGWLEWNPSVRCCGCGYRTSSVERQKLADLWYIYESDSKVAPLLELGKAAGYTPEASMECAIKYTYLKTHRLVECTFDIDEMLNEEGNTFIYLLKTRVLISSLFENSGGRDIAKYTKAFFSKERELALHLVQFTEVIQEACSTFLLHPVCDYLWDLCKIFMSYYSEDSSICSSRVASTQEMTGFEVIPWPVSVVRPKNLNPRFEIFCMNVCVADVSFSKGDMHGIVSLVDTDGLLSDGRLPLDISENGHVAYFHREWYDSTGIRDNGYVYFETPSPPHLDDQLNYKRGTLEYEGDNGCISMDYIALRDAVDTTMKLSLESPGDPFLRACHYLYSPQDVCELEVGPLSLKKSVLAVPVNGTLVLEARFFDKSGNVILDKKRTFHAQTQDSSEWRMRLNEDCFLKLDVEWSQGPKSSYC
nr:arginyl-tRNA synthetase, class Ic [Tanacetum cinerariifolium]